MCTLKFNIAGDWVGEWRENSIFLKKIVSSKNLRGYSSDGEKVIKECELNRFRIFTTSFVLIFPFEINHLSR